MNSLDLDDVHIVGHSLGSHIAGYVGTNLTGSIGRITGLDPAEPYFQGRVNIIIITFMTSLSNQRAPIHVSVIKG